MTSTLRPARARIAPAVKPPRPAPITTTSQPDINSLRLPADIYRSLPLGRGMSNARMHGQGAFAKLAGRSTRTVLFPGVLVAVPALALELPGQGVDRAVVVL